MEKLLQIVDCLYTGICKDNDERPSRKVLDALRDRIQSDSALFGTLTPCFYILSDNHLQVMKAVSLFVNVESDCIVAWRWRKPSRLRI
jgi:hypothetical protein